jgi:hypothetical protein
MSRVDETNSSSHSKGARDVVVELLRNRNRKARFVTELYASLEKSGISATETDEILAKLENEGAVMLRDHFCADPTSPVSICASRPLCRPIEAKILNWAPSGESTRLGTSG